MKKVVFYFFLLVTGTLALSGCYYDNEEELYPNAATCDTSNVTYSGTIQPLIAANCAIPSCHVPNGQTPDLSTYDGLTNNLLNVKTRAIDEKTMPASGPLSDCNIAKLQKWIDLGAPNN